MIESPAVMSLHFLGIRDFPQVQRQLSSPARIPQLPSPTATEDLVQDSKDVLVQRLLDLATHLQEQDLPDESLSTLHHDVDHMERTWQKHPKSPISKSKPPLQSFSSALSTMTSGSTTEEERFWRPISPGLESPIRFAFHSPKASTSEPAGSRIAAVSPLRAALLANEADALLSKLIKVVSELKNRHQESEASHKHRSRASCVFCVSALSTSADTSQHIHDLLVTRAEKAAQRVVELEERIADLDYDYEDTQSELNYMRLAMKAIELQASDNIVFDQDEELTQSIRSWKEQWVELDQKTKERRKKCKSKSSSPESNRMPINP